MTLVALVLAAALNPLVVRSPEPRANVPADCEVSDVVTAPRVAEVPVAEVDNPVAPLPPVRPTTRPAAQYDVRALQNAIAANNRAQFDLELARAREAGVPTRVYEDVGRLWDAQFESPFFAEGSEPHRIASQYPGYEAAVREQLFTDASGRKFYPASETRAFVARQTGVNLPPRTSRSTTRQPSNPATPQPTRTSREPATSKPRESATSKPRDPATRTQTATTRTQTPAARRDSPPPRRSPDPSAAQKPAATVPAPVVPQVEHTSSTTAPPAAGSLPAEPITTTTTSDPLAVDPAAADTAAPGTMVTDTAAMGTAAAETATAVTATTTTGAAGQRGRSIILPTILILIGLGVLLLLFKAR